MIVYGARAMTRKTGELLKTLALVAFLAGGLVLVRIGALPLWLWGVLTAVTVFMRYAARLDAYTEQLEIGDQGVTRRHGSRMRQQLTCCMVPARVAGPCPARWRSSMTSPACCSAASRASTRPPWRRRWPPIGADATCCGRGTAPEAGVRA